MPVFLGSGFNFQDQEIDLFLEWAAFVGRGALGEQLGIMGGIKRERFDKGGKVHLLHRACKLFFVSDILITIACGNYYLFLKLWHNSCGIQINMKKKKQRLTRGSDVSSADNRGKREQREQPDRDQSVAAELRIRGNSPNRREDPGGKP